jgi:hypothetical protein
MSLALPPALTAGGIAQPEFFKRDLQPAHGLIQMFCSTNCL